MASQFQFEINLSYSCLPLYVHIRLGDDSTGTLKVITIIINYAICTFNNMIFVCSLSFYAFQYNSATNSRKRFR